MVDLAAIANDGELLGEVDGKAYRVLMLVVEQNGAACSPYCLHDEWENSAAARLAAIQEKLGPLRSELARLEQSMREIQGELGLAPTVEESEDTQAAALGTAPTPAPSAAPSKRRKGPPTQMEAIAASGCACTYPGCKVVAPDKRRLGQHLYYAHKIHGVSRAAAPNRKKNTDAQGGRTLYAGD
jgi:hypothetical protein